MRDGFVLPTPIQRRLEATALALIQPEHGPRLDFSEPLGEPALVASDSVSWRLFKNPVALFIGGVGAVLLQLAEPRVRTGVWDHTSFREQPVARLQRTGLAAMATVYGARRQTEAMVAGVVRLHERVRGVTPSGEPYRASDIELLNWVHATASYGFLEAHHLFVRPLDSEERDRFYDEGQAAARLYGATDAPRTQREVDALIAATHAKLEPSAIVFEFLQILLGAPVLPRAARPLQHLLVRAAVDVVPPALRERLALDPWRLKPWQRAVVSGVARTTDRLILRSSPAVQACRRLGLRDDHLYRTPAG